ncbi:TetR/AcrR family transcriptional regulator [Paracoccus sp. Z330]|uniref:TetR/AcrR family transcriptional regulator n=1 Tax=Paracoccus onchidii TaxID=3017813 RepID=A0ABT4ZH76_9RHOB|nr:TetR/AcrR family transcriptional regulator [Paracoccus onchidii]MDB6178685.1 TetR/AcrR family transcriptional regulator [Paracoccus onchidii]
MTKISAGLEHAFATQGFAQPSVEDLRDAAGVSLRTLYKYTPSRSDMVYAALEYRHQRYVTLICDDLPADRQQALFQMLDRIGHWMADEATHGCLFHAAVASAPTDSRLHELLERHKSEVAARAAKATQLEGQEVSLLLIFEGLTQTWPLYRERAVASAQKLARHLLDD